MTTTKTTIELDIRFNTAFRISQGYGQGEVDDVIDEENPLPATSLKGVMRDAARMVLPGQLTIVRTCTYCGFDGRTFTGSARAEAAGGLGLINGDATAVDRDGVAEETVSGQVKVSVPLLGGKLEKMVVSHLDRLFEAEYRHLNRWTAAR